MSQRYVISMRAAGLGDRIISLAAAWRFARNTGRTLVVDWRRSDYADQANLFPLCFANMDEIAGVPMIADERVDRLLPRSSPGLIVRRIISGSRAVPDRDTTVALVRAGKDIEASTIVFAECINDAVVSFEDACTFLSALRPVAGIAAAITAFEQQRLGPEPWIGLHVRHGNGGNIMLHASFWTSFDLGIERCVRAIEKAREQLGTQAIVLLCTDSLDVQGAILQRVPGVVCRPKWFREPGVGELHIGGGSGQGRDDALIEMLLLARCSALIRYPSGSFFSFYGAVMKTSRLPSPVDVKELQNPHDPDDEQSATILF